MATNPKAQRETADAAQAFSEIYRQNTWRGVSRSGIGSDPAQMAPYLSALKGTLDELCIDSVVDVGCGDWAFSRHVDWRDIRYVGVDVVPEAVATLRGQFQRDSVSFVCANALKDTLPDAELLVMKDVLQHWPTESVKSFLASKLSGFRYALLTNDIAQYERFGWRRGFATKSLGNLNGDIEMGGWRPIDLRAAPFNLLATEVARFKVRAGPYRWVKQMLLWTNPSARAPRA